MNDPHVVALIYKVKHIDSVDYDKAAPLEQETAAFKLRVDNGEARFELQDHFADADSARAVVEPFVRQWEFAATLDRAPGELELAFRRAEVVDRNPSPSSHVLRAETGEYVMVGSDVKLRIGRASYPPPPSGIAVNADAEAMVTRFARYRQGKDTLAGVGYFCLTVLEQAAGGRPQAASMFGIAAPVLSALGRLTSEKGGIDARKSTGRTQPLSPSEREWMEKALVAVIRRVAEVAHGPMAAAKIITMADLPPL